MKLSTEDLKLLMHTLHDKHNDLVEAIDRFRAIPAADLTPEILINWNAVEQQCEHAFWLSDRLRQEVTERERYER